MITTVPQLRSTVVGVHRTKHCLQRRHVCLFAVAVLAGQDASDQHTDLQDEAHTDAESNRYSKSVIDVEEVALAAPELRFDGAQDDTLASLPPGLPCTWVLRDDITAAGTPPATPAAGLLNARTEAEVAAKVVFGVPGEHVDEGASRKVALHSASKGRTDILKMLPQLTKEASAPTGLDGALITGRSTAKSRLGAPHDDLGTDGEWENSETVQKEQDLGGPALLQADGGVGEAGASASEAAQPHSGTDAAAAAAAAAAAVERPKLAAPSPAIHSVSGMKAIRKQRHEAAKQAQSQVGQQALAGFSLTGSSNASKTWLRSAASTMYSSSSDNAGIPEGIAGGASGKDPLAVDTSKRSPAKTRGAVLGRGGLKGLTSKNQEDVIGLNARLEPHLSTQKESSMQPSFSLTGSAASMLRGALSGLSKPLLSKTSLSTLPGQGSPGDSYAYGSKADASSASFLAGLQQVVEDEGEGTDTLMAKHSLGRPRGSLDLKCKPSGHVHHQVGGLLSPAAQPAGQARMLDGVKAYGLSGGDATSPDGLTSQRLSGRISGTKGSSYGPYGSPGSDARHPAIQPHAAAGPNYPMHGLADLRAGIQGQHVGGGADLEWHADGIEQPLAMGHAGSASEMGPTPGFMKQQSPAAVGGLMVHHIGYGCGEGGAGAAHGGAAMPQLSSKSVEAEGSEPMQGMTVQPTPMTGTALGVGRWASSGVGSFNARDSHSNSLRPGVPRLRMRKLPNRKGSGKLTSRGVLAPSMACAA